MAEEFDIVRAQNLPAASSVSDNDMLLVVQGGMLKRVPPTLMKGKAGDPGPGAFLGVTAKYITWKQGINGSWNNLFEIEKLRGPKGEKPLFQKVGGTLQTKYEGELDTMWVNIFDREELKMKFSDLTPAERDLLKLHFSDLTAADKAELMKPATDGATDARAEITNMRQLEATVEEQEALRENFYTQVQAKEQARQNAELARNTEFERIKTDADSATSNANEKAGLADTAASNANEKAGLADTAASNANAATGDARVVITRLEELEDTLVPIYKMIPASMLLTYPKKVTMRNTQSFKIQFELLPVNTGRNVLFLGDDRAILVSPDGSFTIKEVGMSKVHVIPTENTTLYKTIQINVEEPGMRFTSGKGMRFSGSGGIRLT